MCAVRIGIIGTGGSTGIAAAHLDGYRMAEAAQVTAVYDQNLEMAERWLAQKEGTGICICRDFDEFLDQIDGASICTPNFTHVDYVERLLRAGKHVFCEKPVGVSEDGLEGLEDAAKASSRIHMVNFNYRNIPALQKIHEMIAGGELGRIYVYRHTMGGGRLASEAVPREWRMKKKLSGSGSLGDFGSHIFDTFFYLLGEDAGEFQKLEGNGKICVKERIEGDRMEPVENDDCTVFQGFTDTGVLFSALTSRVGALGNQLEIIGELGIVRFSMENPLAVTYQPRRKGEGFTRKPEIILAAPGSDRWKAADHPEMLAASENAAAFVRCIAENRQPETDILYGIKIQRIIDSVWNGMPVI